MKRRRRDWLPLEPLVHCFHSAAAGLEAPIRLALGPRFQAVRSAARTFLNESFLDQASDGAFRDALAAFYEATAVLPLHVERLRGRAGLVRHALAHLLRCPDPLPLKLARCIAADGPYFVAGLGPSFWSALALALNPLRHAGWTRGAEEGLRRLGLVADPDRAGPVEVYAALLDAVRRVQALAPELTGLHVEELLTLAGRMQGRNLLAGGSGLDLAGAVVALRAREPLRGRLKEQGAVLAEAQERLEAGLRARHGKMLGSALAVADPDGAGRCPLDWGAHGEELTLWIGRLWEADDPHETLAAFWDADPLPGAGLWLPAAVLHLRDPQRFLPFSDAVRAGHALIDDGTGGPVVERYRLLNEAAAWLRQRFCLHPLEVPALLALLVPGEERFAPATTHFGGFCADTFRFLTELEGNNCRAWMESQRRRYHYAVRGPLVELCRALGERYIEPVLRRRHGWDLRTDARNGLALTSVVKNDHGRGRPYNTALWVTFCRREDGRREGVQFFVRLTARGLRYGLRLGAATAAGRRELSARLADDAAGLFHALQERGAFEEGRLFAGNSAEGQRPQSPAELAGWLAGRDLEIGRDLAPDSPLLDGDELTGDVVLTFDRLLPLFARAALGPSPAKPASPAAYTDDDFRRDTYLDEHWLASARSLLRLKRQLILQGVPGTGKTHVARCLARVLATDLEAVRVVQFHPAYSYEEFVEGIKVKSVEVGGRHDVTYPVEDGVLLSFAARAASRPAEPHVLVIDEINRGNLPRIFGELLFLLEYRGEELVLPCSRRPFRLPSNLYLIGTMNASDRSVARLDQALRRRFSFLEMPPDTGVLRAWFAAHPPAAGPVFAERVTGLFDRLNARLAHDLGPTFQVGHSYFMAPGLDERGLKALWRHQVRPLLDDLVAQHPGRAVPELDELLEPERPRRRARAD